MSSGNVQNYEGAADGVEEIKLGGNRWLKCFNNTGGALTHGDVVVVSGLSANSGEAASTKFPTVVTPATQATPKTSRVGVVDTSIAAEVNATRTTSSLGTSWPDQSWGYVQVAGYCAAVTKTTTANPVAIDDYMKAVNGVKTAATNGTSGSTANDQLAFCVAKSVVATGVAGTFSAYLLDHEVVI